MRGVNRLVMEIKGTDSEYFDKAILFLKSEGISGDVSQTELNESADRLLKEISPKRARRGARILPAAAAAIGAAAVTGGIMAAIFIF